MQESDPFVQALASLCEREGGHAAVARLARVSKDNLWQILNGTKLPSGKPRGIGPTLRRKLTATYPAWLTPIASSESAVHKVQEPSPVYAPPVNAGDMCKTICEMFAKLPDDADLRFDVFHKCVTIIKLARESPDSHQGVSEFPGRKPSAA